MKPKTVGRVQSGHHSPVRAQHLCHGFPVATPIMTADGEMPVEYLSPGDRIVTRNGGMTKLISIQAVTRRTHTVRIAADYLGDLSRRDLVLPADQPVLVRDWRAHTAFGLQQAMAAAGHLVDGLNIQDAGEQHLILFRLEFDKPRIVYASGLELGTDPSVNLPLRNVA